MVTVCPGIGLSVDAVRSSPPTEMGTCALRYEIGGKRYEKKSKKVKRQRKKSERNLGFIAVILAKKSNVCIIHCA